MPNKLDLSLNFTIIYLQSINLSGSCIQGKVFVVVVVVVGVSLYFKVNPTRSYSNHLRR